MLHSKDEDGRQAERGESGKLSQAEEERQRKCRETYLGEGRKTEESERQSEREKALRHRKRETGLVGSLIDLE